MVDPTVCVSFMFAHMIDPTCLYGQFQISRVILLLPKTMKTHDQSQFAIKLRLRRWSNLSQVHPNVLSIFFSLILVFFFLILFLYVLLLPSFIVTAKKILSTFIWNKILSVDYCNKVLYWGLTKSGCDFLGECQFGFWILKIKLIKLLILTGLACFVALQFNAVLVHSNCLCVNLHITCTMCWFLFI